MSVKGWASNAAAQLVANEHFAITPHDSNNFTYLTRGIYVGVTGNVTVVTASGAAVLYTAVPAGITLPIIAKRVNATGTTATGLVGMY
jgi:hypothetical protein